MSYEAGTAFLQVVPSFAGVLEAISEEFSKDGDIAAQVLKESFEAGLKGLSPKINVDVDTRMADERLAELDAEIKSLHESVGVDISDADALAKVAFLKGVLKDLSGSIDIKSGSSLSAELNTIAAAAKAAAGAGGPAGGGLAAVGATAADAGLSLSDFLIPSLVILGTALIPLGGLALGGLATLPAALSGLGLGLVAIKLALPGIEFLAKLTFDPLVKSLTPLVDKAILPGIASGLNAIVPLFQALAPFVVKAAGGIGQFVASAGSLLGSGAGIFNIGVLFQAGSKFAQGLASDVLKLIPAFLTVSAQATPILSGIGKGISDLVGDFAKWVANGGFETFVRWVQANGPAIVGDIEHIADAFGPIVVALVPVGLAVLNFLGDIGQLIALAAPVIIFAGQAVGAIISFLDPVSKVQNAISNLQDIWDSVWGALAGPVSSTVGTIGGFLSTLGGFFAAIPGDVSSAFNTAIAFLGTVGSSIGSAMSSVANAISSPFTSAFNEIKRIWNSTVGGFGFSIPGWVPVVGGDSFKIPNMHTGGIVPGVPGSDVPIIMQAGELVIPRSGVAGIQSAAAGGTNEPSRVLNQNINVTAYDPRTAAIETQQRADFAAKTRGF